MQQANSQKHFKKNYSENSGSKRAGSALAQFHTLERPAGDIGAWVGTKEWIKERKLNAVEVPNEGNTKDEI